MSNEELLENLKTKYETILSEDDNISKEIEKLSKERDELPSTDKIQKLEEIEFILKNGKSFKGKLKSLFKVLNGKPIDVLINILNYLCAFLVVATIIYVTFFTGIQLSSISKIIACILNALLTTGVLAFPIADIVYINKINKKYKLEEVSSELDETKKRKEEVDKNLELQEKLHQTKQMKLSELQTTMQNII